MLSDGLLRQMVDAMPMPVFVKDGDGRYLYVNRSFETLFHVRREYLVGRAPDPNQSRQSVDLLRPDLPTCPDVLTESTVFCTATGERLVMGVIHGERTPASSTSELEATKAELREVRQELARMRETDPVTQCLSRRALRAHTEAALVEEQAGVIRITIDDYDSIGRRHGEDLRDQLLRSFSDIVRSATRPDDVFARVAESEFTVILRGSDREQTAMIARRICTAVADTMTDTGDDPVSLSVSVGAASSEDDQAALSSLIEQAEVALRSATPCRNEAVVVGV